MKITRPTYRTCARVVIQLLFYIFYFFTSRVQNRFVCYVVLKIVWQRWMIATPYATSSGYYKRKKKTTGSEMPSAPIWKMSVPLYFCHYILSSLVTPSTNRRVIAYAIWICGFQEAFTIKVSFSLTAALVSMQKPSMHGSYCLKLVTTERPVHVLFRVFHPLLLFSFLFLFFFFNVDIYFHHTLHMHFPVSFPLVLFYFFVSKRFHANLGIHYFALLFVIFVYNGRKFQW